jgi:hypothetical protein
VNFSAPLAWRWAALSNQRGAIMPSTPKSNRFYSTKGQYLFSVPIFGEIYHVKKAAGRPFRTKARIQHSTREILISKDIPGYMYEELIALAVSLAWRQQHEAFQIQMPRREKLSEKEKARYATDFVEAARKIESGADR